MRNKIRLLKNYFKERHDVAMAFVFGSQTKRVSRKISDWDIAIYLKDKDLKIESKIWSDLVDILDKEVDLILLQKAPAILTSRIIREGIPLKIENRKNFLDFFLKITEEADYFLQFSHDYYQIYKRSHSLIETDKARLRKILVFLENSLREFEKFKEMTFEEYSEDLEKRRNIERWAESLMNSVLDASKIILASEKKSLPDTYKKIVLETSILFKFNPNSREKLSEWVELRNIIAHEYLEILWEKIRNFVKNAKPSLDKFLEKAKKFV